MPLEPLPGFPSFPTHHCVTGSLRHVYAYNDHPLSEELLLGLGAGVSFCYWHQKGSVPVLGGRGMPKPSMEELAGRRTGVRIERHATASAGKARQALLTMLAAGRPAMLQCDMGYLPYFDFQGHEYHFGGHVVVACGYDPASDEVLIADRDGLHPVAMEAVEKARGSRHKPFPPMNLWYTFDFSDKRLPTPGEVRQAIAEQVQPMLAPPISNIGVRGIRKAAELVPAWTKHFAGDELRWPLFNAYIFISPVGGSGGGAFRYMFSRFLHEAAQLTGDARLDESAAEFRRIGDSWEALADWFRRTSEAPDPAPLLGQSTALFRALAAGEEAAWTRLREIVGPAAPRDHRE